MPQARSDAKQRQNMGTASSGACSCDPNSAGVHCLPDSSIGKNKRHPLTGFWLTQQVKILGDVTLMLLSQPEAVQSTSLICTQPCMMTLVLLGARMDSTGLKVLQEDLHSVDVFIFIFIQKMVSSPSPALHPTDSAVLLLKSLKHFAAWQEILASSDRVEFFSLFPVGL